MKKLAIASAMFLLYTTMFTACKNGDQTAASIDTATVDGHPAWIIQGNIYEVNIRQYTPEGTFNAFAQHLDRLKEMGVQTLWFMPITPVGEVDRKGKLGSYYAVKDYTAVNPEFGTLEDWKNLVKAAHDKGFKVITDWVANHTAADNRWIYSHKDFYVTDSTGKIVSPFDWTDTRKLNYKNMAMQDSMIAAMKYWVTETGIDGFRCDVAAEVPESFWTRAITELKKVKNVFMLAEANDGWLHKAGFDQTYAWEDFSVMKKVATGEKNALSIDSVINKTDTTHPANALRLYFTSNHDENSWNKADYATMPGEVHAPFAVLTQTIKRSVPLIYSGQEEPFLDSLSFFYKDTISFGKYQRAAFYKTLLNLRKNNPALSGNAAFKKLETSNNTSIYAFEREKNGKKVLVVLNLSKTAQNFAWVTAPSASSWTNVFTQTKETVPVALQPWGYAVYEL